MNIIRIMNIKKYKKFGNLRKFLVCISFLSLCLNGAAKHSVPATPITKIYWSDITGKIYYSVNANPSPVVKIALDLFANDMKAVTGFAAQMKPNATLQIYQLDQLTKKENSALNKLGLPLHQLVNKREAFYIATRKNKIIVVGSDSRGTAYGVMELSKMAGVSPWGDWNDLQPQQKKYLSTKVGFETLQMPAVEHRGFALNNTAWMKSQNYSRICRLMLRLRANTLWQTDNKHEAIYNKAVVDSFDICIGEHNKVTEITGKKHKKHKKTVDNIRILWNDNQLWLSNTAPGLLVYEMTQHNLGNEETKSHKSHNSDQQDGAWIANVRNPKLATYQLSLFMDMAWNKESVNSNNIEKHLQTWLIGLFGDKSGRIIFPLLKEYYRLTSIRQPEYMVMPYGDTEFHSGEFSNELEKYLYAYDILKKKVSDVEKTLPRNQNDGFFELVKYPIYSAALIAEKELEAQEARYIARPGLFDKDNEAKAAAAVSLNAYNTLKQLNAYYAKIGKGKWSSYLFTSAAAMQAPILPGTLTNAAIKRYLKEAFDREEDIYLPYGQYTGIVAKNACDWTTVSGLANEQANKLLMPLIGHSNKSVALPRGCSLNYTFYCEQAGDARFTLAGLPNYTPMKGDMRVSVSIDHATPVICQLKDVYNSKDWKFSIWRGQALKSFYLTLKKGNHSLEIKALDNHVVLDQWILDFDVDREYYVIPTHK